MRCKQACDRSRNGVGRVFGPYGQLVFATSENLASVIDLETGETSSCLASGRVQHFSPLGIVHNSPFGPILWDPTTGQRRNFEPDASNQILLVRRDGAAQLVSYRSRVVPGSETAGKSYLYRRRFFGPRGATEPKRPEGRGFESMETLLTRSKEAADPNDRTRAARRLGWFFGAGARNTLHTRLASWGRNYGLRNSIFEAFAWAGNRADAAGLQAAVDGFPSDQLATTLATLGHAGSLAFLGTGLEDVPQNNDSDREGIRRAIALLKQRPAFERHVLASLRLPSFTKQR